MLLALKNSIGAVFAFLFRAALAELEFTHNSIARQRQKTDATSALIFANEKVGKSGSDDDQNP